MSRKKQKNKQYKVPLYSTGNYIQMINNIGKNIKKNVCVCVCVCLIAQSCLTLCDPMN